MIPHMNLWGVGGGGGLARGGGGGGFLHSEGDRRPCAEAVVTPLQRVDDGVIE